MGRRRRLLVAVVAAGVALAAAVALFAAGDGADRPDAGVLARYDAAPGMAPFIVGVWLQPSYSFARWRDRGINTIVARETLSGTVPYDQWRADLEAAGLSAIRPPEGDPAQDAQDRRLRAWMHGDEPDLPDKTVSPQRLARDYEEWKAAAPTKPVFVNFSGAEILKRGRTDLRYGQWTAAADWISNDLYPVTGFGRPDWLDLRSTSEPEAIGAVLDQLHRIGGRKPLLQIVEASDQQLFQGKQSRSVTPGELRGSVWQAIIHGARGIVYFPLAFGAQFRFEAIPPAVEREMVRVNKVLKERSDLLLAAGARVRAPRPFEVGTRGDGDDQVRIILNLSPRPAAFEGRRFGPYEVLLRRGEDELTSLSDRGPQR